MLFFLSIALSMMLSAGDDGNNVIIHAAQRAEQMVLAESEAKMREDITRTEVDSFNAIQGEAVRARKELDEKAFRKIVQLSPEVIVFKNGKKQR